MNYQKIVTMYKDGMKVTPQNHNEYMRAIAEGYREYPKQGKNIRN